MVPITGSGSAPGSVGAVEPAAARLPRANPHEVRHVLARVGDGWPRFAPATDRVAWKAVAARNPVAVVEGLLAAGRAAAARPVPALPVSLWRQFARDGSREAYERRWSERRSLLADLVLAYSLEPEDALLDPMVDVLWAICEETTWCYPAHHHGELPDPQRPVLDLFAALTAVQLAECLHVLRQVLPGPLVEWVEREVDVRAVTPYLEDDTLGWLYNSPTQWTNNWTAVCAFGVVGAACYLERDQVRLAALLCKAARSMEEFLESFDPDGGTSEGTAYWSFGFGSFCELADVVERRTGGAWSWFDAPIVERIARFPLTSRLTRDSWPTFSDADADVRFPGALLASLGERFAVPQLVALARTPVADWSGAGNSPLSTLLRSLHAGSPESTSDPLPVPDVATRWFSGLQWWLAVADSADPASVAVAMKGGHNAEMHNQNDIGALIVRIGGEDLVVDPGRGRYTRDYFGALRYEHLVNRSRGHSVPLPGGTEQAVGARYRAQVVAREQVGDADRLVLDLTGAYPPDAAVERLERTVMLHRGAAPWVELVDEVSFAAAAVAETAFVTFARVEVSDGTFVLRGDRAAARVTLPAGTVVGIEVEDVAFPDGVRRVSRVAVRSTRPVRQARFAFRIDAV